MHSGALGGGFTARIRLARRRPEQHYGGVPAPTATNPAAPRLEEASGIRVRFIGAETTEHTPAELDGLLSRHDGFVWLDVPVPDDSVAELLVSRFDGRPQGIRLCLERNHVAQVSPYPEHLVFVLHAPLRGETGHVHLLELDLIVGKRYLVTVHGPLNPVVPLEAALVETDAIWDRLRTGRLRTASPAELAHTIGTAIARRQHNYVSEVAGRLADLEKRVMDSDFRKPEELLDEMFLLRHELLVVRTMAEQSHQAYARAESLARHLPGQTAELVSDLADHFARVRGMADGEKEFLIGVLDFYQSRISTKMTIASERLAVLAAVTLPVTAIASVEGMNFAHMPELRDTYSYPIALGAMAVIAAYLLSWARRQGWW